MADQNVVKFDILLISLANYDVQANIFARLKTAVEVHKLNNGQWVDHALKAGDLDAAFIGTHALHDSRTSVEQLYDELETTVTANFVHDEIETKLWNRIPEVQKFFHVALAAAKRPPNGKEFSSGKEVHFLQKWSFPKVSGHQPKNFTRYMSDAGRQDRGVKVVARVGESDVEHTREANSPAPVQSDPSLHHFD
ncbi:hypothetical protein AGABI1DRAFT_90464 [Agaricus bisporus var. burnettii JB137-S8]|uniref:Uncharacterized protein n=1 Tax=Agaricus bisporus var. burnettii (strain JB137-S8 / ATCC MYA-4627 / FGSC 10392) TaxID=597362 RepID=K5W5W0_AGABU|nr:uncharacterized protein AGABI1DRAFT_90464 [Agaricus bisporus var. burnettii JB137-S8]EKM82209.1 hypothetical protein AGABI1DRAFT_90464 [Agaricus bisporus var. burnettii JB137-S8]